MKVSQPAGSGLQPQSRAIARQTAFLTAYEECASIKAAAKAARVSRQRHYKWLQTDPDYRRKFEKAKILAVGALEDEAVERATVGVFEPNVYQGRFCYPQEEYVVKPAVLGKRGAVLEPEVRAWRDVPGAPPLGLWKKSDKLLMFLLRGWMPEKYGFRGAVELSGAGGGAIEVVERLQAARRRAAQMAAA
jgi:hypothetical protein